MIKRARFWAGRREILLATVILAATHTGWATSTYTWTDGGADNAWNTGSPNWSAGGGNVAWTNDYTAGSAGTTDLAFFGASPAPTAVTVSGKVLTNGLTFGAGGWTLADSGGGLAAPDPASPGNVITILNPTAGNVATIDAIIKDNDGTLTGTAGNTVVTIGSAGEYGNVFLGANNTYSGVTNIFAGPFSGSDVGLRGAAVVTANNALGNATGVTVIGNASTLGVLAFSGGVQYTTPETINILNGGYITGAIRSTDGENLFAGNITLTTSGNDFFGVDTGSSLTLTGKLSGAGTLWKVGGGQLILNGTDSSLTGTLFIGMIGNNGAPSIINAAGSVVLGSGAAGVGSIHSGTVEVSWTGSLVIDSSGKTSAGNTIRSTGALTLENSGNLTVFGSASSDTSDSFGGVLNVGPTVGLVGSGDSSIVVAPQGHVTLIKFASLQRNTTVEFSSGTVTFMGPNFGNPAAPVGTAGVAQVMFSSAPGMSSNGGSTGILPYGVVVDTATGLTALATYDATNGIRGLSGADYGSGNTVAATLVQGNNLITASKLLSGSSGQVNSLTLQGSNITLGGSGNYTPGTGPATLSLFGGAVVSDGSGNALNFSGLATLQSDFFFNVTGDLTVNCTLLGTNKGLQKTGPGELILTGASVFTTTTASSHLNPIKISGGTLTFSAVDNLGNGANFIDLYSGTLHATGGTLAAPRTIDLTVATITAGSGGTNGGLDASAIKIAVDAYTTLKITAVNTSITYGQTGYTKIGPGTLYLTGGLFTSIFNGTSFLAEGTLAFGSSGDLAPNGTLAASPGTTVWFDSSSRGTTLFTHLGEVRLDAATFAVTGNSSNNTSDGVHSVTFGAGTSEVNITRGGNHTTLLTTVTALTREPGATVVYSGAGLGTAAASVALVEYGAAPALSGGAGGAGGILPWALTDTTVGGAGTAFATYAANGITANLATTAGISAGNALVTANDAGTGTINSLTISGNGISAGSGTLTIASGGILNLGGSNTIAANTLALGAAEGIVHAITDLAINSQITGSAGLTKTGAGTLTLAGNNPYTGPATWINAGTLSVSNDNSLGDSSVPVIFNYSPGGSGLMFTGSSSSTRGMTISEKAAATICVSGGDTVTWNGVIGGAGSLEKTGPGTLNLTGANTYAGPTTISAGTLLVNNASATGAGPVTLNAGTLGGYGSISSTLTLGAAPHTIAPSAAMPGGSHGTLALASLATNADTTLAFNLITPGSICDRISVSDSNGLTLNGGALQIAHSSTGAASLGYYKAMQYAGAIQGAGAGSLAMPTTVNNIAYTLSTTHDPGYIDVHRGLLGDANDDGLVNFADFVVLSNNFGLTNKGWGGGDFNADGITNFADFVILSNNFGGTVGANAVAEPGASSASGVPEPISVALLGMGLGAAMLRRRRNGYARGGL